MALVEIDKQSLGFTLYFSDEFFEKKPEEQRTTVTHELLHVLQQPAKVMLDSFGYVLSSNDKDNYKILNERFIDNLAHIISKNLPLPKIKGDKK